MQRTVPYPQQPVLRRPRVASRPPSGFPPRPGTPPDPRAYASESIVSPALQFWRRKHLLPSLIISWPRYPRFLPLSAAMGGRLAMDWRRNGTRTGELTELAARRLAGSSDSQWCLRRRMCLWPRSFGSRLSGSPGSGEGREVSSCPPKRVVPRLSRSRSGWSTGALRLPARFAWIPYSGATRGTPSDWPQSMRRGP